MSKVGFKEFSLKYNKHLSKVISFYTDEMQENIAGHNLGWAKPFSFNKYLEKSVKRFYIAYLNIPKDVKTCCDIGGFWGVYPLVLKDLGYEVTMTESLKFYDSSFDGLFEYIRSQGVEIMDVDPFNEEIKVNDFNYISVMAVLEHIPSSIKYFLNNLKSSLSDKGTLYIEVPNIAYYQKRIDLLFGNSPLPNIDVVYNSKVPFIGHHHEYSVKELYQLFQLINFEVINFEKYNYSFDTTLLKFLRRPFRMISFLFFPNTKEVIAAIGRKI